MVIKLPKYVEKNIGSDLIKLDEFSCIMYNPTIGQENVATYVTKSLFVLILKGKKLIHTDCGDIEINAGDVFFAQKGSYLLSEKLNDDSCYQSLIFFIDDNFLLEFAAKNQQLLSVAHDLDWEGPSIYKIASTPMLESGFKSIMPFFLEDVPNKKEILRIKLEELFFHMINAEDNKQFLRFLKRLQHPEKLDLTRFMNENFTLPLTLDEFARHTARSLTAFKNEFKQLYNESPKKWINRQRLDRARTMVENTDKSVTEICLDVGFESVSHFIQLFKKRFGVTPKKLRSGN